MTIKENKINDNKINDINQEDEIFELRLLGWDFPCEECPEWVKDEERCFWDGKDVPLCFVVPFDEYYGKK